MGSCFLKFLAVVSSVVFVSATLELQGSKVTFPRRKFARDGAVDLSALQAHVQAVQTKIAQGLENFEKNTGSPSPSDNGALRRLAKRFLPLPPILSPGVGLDPLTFDPNPAFIWQGNIQVGTPANTFSVDFDTGSSDTFLPGVNCTDVNCQGHRIYNTSASKTAVDQHEAFSIPIAGTISGEQFDDTVSIAGLTAKGQRIGAASMYNPNFGLPLSPPDGLAGMGFQEISVFNASPIFQTLVAQKKVRESVFGFTLLPNGSEVFLGGTDNRKFIGELTFTPVTQPGFWQIEFDGASVGTKSVFKNKTTAIVDTGTFLIIGDSVNVAKIHSEIPGAKVAPNGSLPGFFTIPCATPPGDVSITIAGRQFFLQPKSIIFEAVSPGSADCFSGIMADDSVASMFWVLGDVFLQNTYTEFDFGNKRVGFAPILGETGIGP